MSLSFPRFVSRHDDSQSLSPMDPKDETEAADGHAEHPDQTSAVVPPNLGRVCTDYDEDRKWRRKWTNQEDTALRNLVASKGSSMLCWKDIAMEHGFSRTSKQCRERWQNQLRPNIKKGKWTVQEEQAIRDMYAIMGTKWTTMAKMMPNRTDNDIKNKWYSMHRSSRAATQKRFQKLLNLKNNSLGVPPRCSVSVQQMPTKEENTVRCLHPSRDPSNTDRSSFVPPLADEMNALPFKVLSPKLESYRKRSRSSHETSAFRDGDGEFDRMCWNGQASASTTPTTAANRAKKRRVDRF